MGFLNFAKKIISLPQKLHSEVVRKVGEVLQKSNNSSVWKIGFKLEEIADKIEPKCYKASIASNVETVDFEKRCTEYYNIAIREINPKIDSIILDAKTELLDKKRVFQYCVTEDFFEQIKRICETASFKAERDEILSSVGQAFSNDNKEFLRIVEIRDDKERQEEFKKFVGTKIEEICNNFVNVVTQKKDEYITSMVKIVREYCEQQELILDEIKNHYEEMIKEKSNPDFVSNRFSKSAVDIAYSKCILSLIYQNS